jgi:hypothetical protein
MNNVALIGVYVRDRLQETEHRLIPPTFAVLENNGSEMALSGNHSQRGKNRVLDLLAQHGAT